MKLKTLQQIKDDVAADAGFNNWNYLTMVWAGFSSKMEPYHNEVARRYATQAIYESAFRAQVKVNDGRPPGIDKDSIYSLVNELK